MMRNDQIGRGHGPKEFYVFPPDIVSISYELSDRVIEKGVDERICRGKRSRFFYCGSSSTHVVLHNIWGRGCQPC